MKDDDVVPEKPTFLNEKSCPSMNAQGEQKNAQSLETFRLNDESALNSMRN
jgi:hypothetical protein